MRRVMLAIGIAAGLGGCSYGDMLDTIPANSSDRYVPPSPPVYVTATPAKEETAFLQAGGCMDCQEGDRFHRFIHSDPDVRKSRIPRNSALAGDISQAQRQWVDEIRTAVYFSKQIRLADGQSLFELISHCGKGWDSPASEAVFTPQTAQGAGFRIEYWIRFKKYGQPIGLQMHASFIRSGDRLIANSQFAESLLRNPQFMPVNQLRCWND